MTTFTIIHVTFFF